MPERRPCDTCSYPCYIARVLLNHKGLSCCFSCALRQPKYLEGAACLLHPQYPEFHYIACLLQGGSSALPGASAVPEMNFTKGKYIPYSISDVEEERRCTLHILQLAKAKIVEQTVNCAGTLTINKVSPSGSETTIIKAPSQERHPIAEPIVLKEAAIAVQAAPAAQSDEQASKEVSSS